MPWQDDEVVAPPGTAPPPSTLGGYAKAAGAGLINAGTGALGILGDTRDLYNALLEAAGGEVPASVKAPSRLTPTSTDVRQALEENVGPVYKPQGRVEEGIAKAAEWLPNILAGPGGVARRGIEQVAAPLAGTEAAGALAEGTGYEIPAEIAGGLVGGMTAPSVERVTRPSPIEPTRQRLIDALEQGQPPVELTAGQRTGSRPAEYLETELGGEMYQRRRAQQGEAATQRVLNEIGEQGESRATPQVLTRAEARIGTDFDRLASTAVIPLDQQLQNNLLDAVTEFQSTGGVAGGPESVMNLIADLAAQNGGVLRGEAYQTIRSRLGKWTRTGPPEIKQVARDMQEALDNAVERHMPAEHMEEWQQARRQWRNFLVVKDVMSTGGQEVGQGIIPLQKLRAAMEANRPDSYSLGRGELSELAHAGETFMREPPQSGTASRATARLIPTAIGAGLGGGLGSLMTGNLGAAGLASTAGGLAGAAAPAIYGRAAMTRPVQNWIAGQQPGAMSEATRRQLLLQALMAPRLFQEEGGQ